MQPTARELYAREFQEMDTIDLRAWKNAFQLAKQDSLKITLPYVEAGTYQKDLNVVYSYESDLQEGSILTIEAKPEVLGVRVFLDVYKLTADSSLMKLTSNKVDENWLKLPIDENGTYKISIQPELSARGNFTLTLQAKPSFGFPVVGKDSKAIQSFWGAPRDRGGRSHEGVDIFAPRGTPILAVTEGRISFTGNRGLGGKQVWLRTGVFGKSLYYAHLDSILVSTGRKVALGDTLGWVGNTGNARTTAPHLHFGIYKRGKGAIDPLPFIRQMDPANQPSHGVAAKRIVVSGSVANLRQSPTTKGLKIGTVKRNDTLNLLGQTSDWGHVRLQNGQRAFIHSSLIAPL